jgi:hypothetical protein
MDTYSATSDVIACTLDPMELKATQAAWQAFMNEALVTRDEVAGGIRLAFRAGTEAELARLIAIETGCCRWINFAVDGTAVTMTAAGDGEAALRKMWRG